MQIEDYSLSTYISEGLKIIARSGLNGLLHPLVPIRQIYWTFMFWEGYKAAANLTYSQSDYENNSRIIANFKQLVPFNVKTINWFVPAFRRAYGGIHTILRFAAHFQSKGVVNRLVFYGDPKISETLLSENARNMFKELRDSPVFVLRDYDVKSLPAADVSIATEWRSAYLVLKFNDTKGKFYFIQDFEPLFFPAGTLYALAEATYHFGFCGICNTPGLLDVYKENFNGIGDFFVPCIDKHVFYPSNRQPSSASAQNPFTIFFYGRPAIPRNAFELGAAALKKIKGKYGDKVRIISAGNQKWNPKNFGLASVMENLGLLPYEETADLYRSCDLGIAFMFTRHPSYLPFEMMACGCPVLSNHNPATKWFLKDNVNCVLAKPCVDSICDKIELVINDLRFRELLIANGVASVTTSTWQTEMDKIFSFICNPHGYDRNPSNAM
jgi:glycosyltransferase involved in cell wall biosynthesis